jgi:NADH dehydrogenase
LSAEEFVYKNPGSLATIGRNAAVAEVGGLRLRGFAAWLVWLVVHLMRLVGFRNRLVVLINWAWDYFFYDRAVRLIMPCGRWPWTSPWRGDESGEAPEA